MAWRSPRKDFSKIYARIDKIAKGGRDNYLEYYKLVDDMVKKGQLALLEQTIYYKYKAVELNAGASIKDFKNKSWYIILEGTRSKLQEDKNRLIESNNLYTIGITYYREIPRTQIKAIDSLGYGSILNPVINNGGLVGIQVEKSGMSYSNATTIQIIGGDGSSTATPIIRAGKIYQVQVTATGSYHNQDVKVGTIEERDYYGTEITDVAYTADEYQKLTGNKKTYLIVHPISATFGTTFSTWDSTQTYDRNVMNLYQSGVQFLIS
jgi:hypothetical protein